MHRWKNLGYSDDPFFWSCLNPIKDHIDNLYVRRSYLDSIFNELISSKNCGIICISGGYGVGKTTFINANQYFLYTSDNLFTANNASIDLMLPCFSPIVIGEGGRINRIEEILKSILYSICFSLNEIKNLRINNLTPSLNKIVNKYVLSVNNISIKPSLDLGKLKLSGERERPSQIIMTTGYYSDKIRNLVKEIVTTTKFNMGVIIVIQNLESYNDNELIKILEDLRDYLFNIEYLKTILISRLKLSKIIKNSMKLSPSLMGEELFIPQLTISELNEMIIKRYEHFKIVEHPARPVPDYFVNEIYMATYGDLRSTVNILHKLTLEIGDKELFKKKRIIEKLCRDAKKEIRELNKNEKTYLNKICSECKKMKKIIVGDSRLIRLRAYMDKSSRKDKYNNIKEYIIKIWGNLIKKGHLRIIREESEYLLVPAGIISITNYYNENIWE